MRNHLYVDEGVMTVESQPIRLSTTGKLIAVAIIVALAIIMFRALGNVATPFIAAAITAYLFNPLITWLHRRTGVARPVWIGLLYVVLGVLIYYLVRFVGPLVVHQYRALVAILPGMLNTFRQQLLLDSTISIGDFELNVGPADVMLRDLLAEVGRRIPEMVPHIFATAFETLLLLVSYLMVTYYLLDQSDKLMEWFYGLVPAPYRAEIRSLGHQIDAVLAGYIRGTLLLIPIMAILTYIPLTLLGVRYALVLAIFSGVVEIIPLIGPWTAAGTSIVAAILQNPTPMGWPIWLLGGIIGLIYFVLRIFEDNFIIPHVVGPAVHLPPILVIFAILSGGALGGAFGLFVSIPVAAVMRLLLRYVYYKLIDRDPPPLFPSHSPPETPSEPIARPETEEPRPKTEDPRPTAQGGQAGSQ
jgi:predicted PurR-regulated permease PerM